MVETGRKEVDNFMNNNIPFTYEYLNSVNGKTPQAFVRIHNTAVSRFFKKYLMQDAISVFDWTLPDWWDADYFRYCLMGFGFVAIFRTDLYGVIPQHCTLSGYNVFYRPTRALVANPLLQSLDMRINQDCALLKLMPDYSSVADLVDYYGDLMALCYESLGINILNSRLSYVIGVDGKAEADTFKLLFDEILSGSPAVVYRKKPSQLNPKTGAAEPWQTVLQNLTQNFIAPDLLESLNAIRDEFLTMIGIPNLSERKKERVNTIDSQRNTVETQSKIDLWLDELQTGIDQTLDLFPDLSGLLAVAKRYEPEELEVTPDENNAVSGGAV